MDSGLLLEVVVRKDAAILQLLASEDQALLIWWDAILVLDLGLTLSMVSETSTSSVMALPVKVFAKISIPPRRRKTRWRVDSFRML